MVLIVADDQGRDLGCCANRAIGTAHIDEFAASGVRFTNGFATADPLPNARDKSAGDFVGAFRNKVRLLATANPKVSFKDYRAHRQDRPQGPAGRRLKNEGYGIVRIDRTAREIVLACRPWNVDPAVTGSRQFAGWPIRLRFDEI